MTPSAGFNLITNPWILVQDTSGQTLEVSLLEAFERSSDLSRLTGDLPTQPFATLRLMLAIVHRAIDGPANDAEWVSLWENEALPIDQIADYLHRHHERFDLFGERPFYQVAGLHTSKNEFSDLNKLIADVPDGAQFFTTRAGDGLKSIGLAEASRWLVHLQAFDPSGIKSGAVGDSRVKGGRGYPIGQAWAGHLGGLVVEGRNLREMILLNLVPREQSDLEWEPRTDLPPWERAPLGPDVEQVDGRDRPGPRGPIELYTWQSRRVLLRVNDGSVTGVLVCNGDRLTPQNIHRVEPMSAWRYSAPQSKRAGTTVYMPREHDPSRSLWRGLNALLPWAVKEKTSNQPEAFLAPTTFGFLARVGEHPSVDFPRVLRVRALGLAYGSNNSVVADLIDDVLALPVALLIERNPELGEIAISAVDAAEKGAYAIGNLAVNLSLAAGGSGDGAREYAQEQLFHALEPAFRKWLAGVDRFEDDPQLGQATWHREAWQRARSLAQTLIARAGVTAWRGRVVKGKHLDAVLAEQAFQRQLAGAFPQYKSTTLEEAS